MKRSLPIARHGSITSGGFVSLPSNVVLDEFNQPFTDPTDPLGEIWATDNIVGSDHHGLKLEGGALKMRITEGNAYTALAHRQNFVVSALITAVPSTYLAIYFAMAEAGSLAWTGYVLVYTHPGAWVIRYRDPSDHTMAFVDSNPTGPVMEANTMLTIARTGSAINVYTDSVLALTATDTTYVRSGLLGIEIGDANASIDRLLGTSLITPPPPPPPPPPPTAIDVDLPESIQPDPDWVGAEVTTWEELHAAVIDPDNNGKCIWVRGGNYFAADPETLPMLFGFDVQPEDEITIIGYPGETPRFKDKLTINAGQNLSFRRIKFDGGIEIPFQGHPVFVANHLKFIHCQGMFIGWAFFNGVHDVLIEACELDIVDVPHANGIAALAYITDTSLVITNYTIRGCKIRTNADATRYSGVVNGVLEDTLIWGLDEYGDHSDGLQTDGANQGEATHGLTIRRCWIKDGNFEPLFLAKDGLCRNLRVEDVLITGIGSGAPISVVETQADATKPQYNGYGFTLSHCTIWDCATLAILYPPLAQDQLIQYNVLEAVALADRTTGQAYFDQATATPIMEAAGITQDYNVMRQSFNWGNYGAHDVNADLTPPVFVDQEAGDYRLASGSPGYDFPERAGISWDPTTKLFGFAITDVTAIPEPPPPPPPPPDVTFPDGETTLIDDFDRADETGGISGEVLGPLWDNKAIDQVGPAYLKILDNQLANRGPGSQSMMLDDFGPELRLHIAVPVLPTDYVAFYTGLVDWYSADWTGYIFLYVPGGRWVIRRHDVGNSTPIFDETGGEELSAGDRIGWEVLSDGSLAMYHYNGTVWTKVAGATDSTYVRAGRVGVEAGDVNMRLDDLRGGTI